MKKNKKNLTLKMNTNNSFDKWINDLVKEQKIDTLEIYTIKEGNKHYEITVEQIIECLKLLDNKEKKQVKDTLEEILKQEGKIIDCLKYLGVGCIKIIDEINTEEDEEAM